MPRSCAHSVRLAAVGTTIAVLGSSIAIGSAGADTRPTDKQPVAIGSNGAVATVDADATAAGIDVLRKGGNAVDAAVAAAATLGVTEPFSAGIGGGGFFVYFDAATGEVHTIDGRETAPLRMEADAFVDESTGLPIPFADAVTSGLSAGVPGTPMTWQTALERWGTIRLKEALKPATRVATRGFVVDQTFRDQTLSNATRFDDFTSTRDLFLPGGDAPQVGSVFRNRDLADTYRRLGQQGVDLLYRGQLAQEIVQTVQQPPVAPDVTRLVREGLMEVADLAAYEAPLRPPTRVDYRGLEVFGMGPPSSGGSTVGEALNILEHWDLGVARPSAGVAPLYGGQRAELRRPQPLRRGRARRTARRAAVAGVRGRASLSRIGPTRRDQAGAPGIAGRRLRPLPGGCRRGYGGVGRNLDHAPHGRRPMGQRRRLHAHHRVDRR